MGIAEWLMSAFMSIALAGILAFTSMSLKFLGRLYPQVNLFLNRKSVVTLLPRISQFFEIRSLKVESCGW